VYPSLKISDSSLVLRKRSSSHHSSKWNTVLVYIVSVLLLLPNFDLDLDILEKNNSITREYLLYRNHTTRHTLSLKNICG